MRKRDEIIKAAITYMEGLIGMDYSKTYRYRWHKGGSTDCSGYVYAAYLAAGYPLLMDGAERMTSMYEVYADGFELKFPETESEIGKSGKWAEKGFYRSFAFQPGDLIFYCFDADSTRSNKITHVAMCYDKTHIIHTANNREKACIKDISYGDGKIVAVTRLKADAVEMARKQLQKGSAERVQIRRLQALLNTFGERLECDGVWGQKTEAVVEAFQRAKGLSVDGICGGKTWAALTGGADKPQDVPAGSGYAFTRNMKKGMSGADVAELQKLLNTGMNAGLEEDGIFGSKTQKAVRDAQKRHHLTVDGIAGRNTITALGGKWEVYPARAAADTVTVCTFNIKRGTYKKGTYQKMAEIVKGADIVGIQEVTPSGLERIAGYAEKTAHMCETISGYGHAALTDYSVDREEIITLPGSGERRKVHHMMIGDISYYNTHFHYTEPTCTKQLEALAAMLKKDASPVVIVTGDFNRQEYEAFTLLGLRQVNRGQAIAATEGSASIVNKIDNVFVRGALVTDVWKYEAVTKGYSDHDALFVKVRL